MCTEGFDPEDIWIPAERYHNAPIMEQYGESIYWTMQVFLGNDTHPENSNQTLFTTCFLFVGIGVFASIIGSASSLLSSLDAVAEQQKAQIESISHYMVFHSVPKELRQKISDFYDYLWRSGQSMHDRNLFDQLPESLNIQLDLSLKRKLINKVPMFKELQPSSVLGIIRAMIHTIAIPSEMILRQGEIGETMFFLMKGSCDGE
jgi:hypothetical protein